MVAQHGRESRVRYYCRQWPAVFAHARGSRLIDENGVSYLDFFAAAGTLNYGHSPQLLVDGVVAYLSDGGPLTTLDMATVAKRELLTEFGDRILLPRGLRHRVQFTSPSGSSAVEAALRLARKATGRARVVCLTGGYHGMTADAASVSDRPGAGLPAMDPVYVTRIPHEYDAGGTRPALDALARAFSGPGAPPAALVLEVVQGEGGARPLSDGFLVAADAACRAAGVVLIVDDIQAGCGRTGAFFSFEQSGISPGIVCLSKGISALGLPLSLVLIEPDLDVWTPGEHSGTFRGNQLAYVTARLGIQHWWHDDSFAHDVRRKSALLMDAVNGLDRRGLADDCRGRGLLLGLPCISATTAQAVARAAFGRQLLVETCGRSGDVVKLSPPLTVTDAELAAAVGILGAALDDVRRDSREPARSVGRRRIAS